MFNNYLMRIAAPVAAILLGTGWVAASDCGGCSRVDYVPSSSPAQSECCGTPVPEYPVVSVTADDISGYNVLLDEVTMRRDRLDVVPGNPAGRGDVNSEFVGTYDSFYNADAGYLPPAGNPAFLADVDGVYTPGTSVQAVYTPGKGGEYCESDVRLDYGTAPENTTLYNPAGAQKNDPRFSIDPRAAGAGLPVTHERGADYGLPASEASGLGAPSGYDNQNEVSRDEAVPGESAPINTSNTDESNAPANVSNQDTNESNAPVNATDRNANDSNEPVNATDRNANDSNTPDDVIDRNYGRRNNDRERVDRRNNSTEARGVGTGLTTGAGSNPSSYGTGAAGASGGTTTPGGLSGTGGAGSATGSSGTGTGSGPAAGPESGGATPGGGGGHSAWSSTGVTPNPSNPAPKFDTPTGGTSPASTGHGSAGGVQNTSSGTTAGPQSQQQSK